MHRDSQALLPRLRPEKNKALCALLLIFLGYLGVTIASFYLEQQMRFFTLVVCIVLIVIFPLFVLFWIICAVFGLILLIMSDEWFEEYIHFTRDHNFWGDKNVKHCRTGECLAKGNSGFRAGATKAAGRMKNCPHCGVFIPRDARVCHSCGSFMSSPQGADATGTSRRTKTARTAPSPSCMRPRSAATVARTCLLLRRYPRRPLRGRHAPRALSGG